jgi:hypothetical protein
MSGDDAVRAALLEAHELAMHQEWSDLRDALARLSAHARDADADADADADNAVPDPASELRRLVDEPALQRLARDQSLRAADSVRRYIALCERQGPLAGSRAAAAQGRASARVGDLAEEHAVHAFREIAALVGAGAHAPYRVVRGLRTPPGCPGDGGKAKDEWDAAILRAGEDIVLLAEVKASPAAAAPDYPRLMRGLLRLSHADADARYAFASREGAVEIAGASLRALRPHGRLLPPQVIYCCTADTEPQPAWLGAAPKAVLLAEPASMAFAQEIVEGREPQWQNLESVWNDLPHTPRLRSTLHQLETAQAARAAMLHPDDLLAAVHEACARA